MNFASDNTSPVHPRIMAAMAAAAAGYARSYGADEATARAVARIRELFEAPEAGVWLVATGTAANALALACLCPPWGTVFCHPDSHIAQDECGAVEFYTGGGRLVSVPGPSARLEADALAEAVARAAPRGIHNMQPAAVSITEVTEFGALYTPDEVARIAGIAHGRGLRLHMDGARLANALAALGCSPAELTWRAGVDALSLGATKNGAMAVEAVVVFDPALAGELELRRKRGGHLFSKHRYLGAQMAAYLEDGLWLELAARANGAAARLAAGLERSDGVRLLHRVEANMVFAEWDRGRHRSLRDAGAVYDIDDPERALAGDAAGVVPARMVASWCSTGDDVDGFLRLLG